MYSFNEKTVCTLNGGEERRLETQALRPPLRRTASVISAPSWRAFPDFTATGGDVARGNGIVLSNRFTVLDDGDEECDVSSVNHVYGVSDFFPPDIVELLTNKDRNKSAHSANGNVKRKDKKPKKNEVVEKKVSQENDRKRWETEGTRWPKITYDAQINREVGTVMNADLDEVDEYAQCYPLVAKWFTTLYGDDVPDYDQWVVDWPHVDGKNGGLLQRAVYKVLSKTRSLTTEKVSKSARGSLDTGTLAILDQKSSKDEVSSIAPTIVQEDQDDDDMNMGDEALTLVEANEDEELGDSVVESERVCVAEYEVERFIEYSKMEINSREDAITIYSGLAEMLGITRLTPKLGDVAVQRYGSHLSPADKRVLLNNINRVCNAIASPLPAKGPNPPPVPPVIPGGCGGPRDTPSLFERVVAFIELFRPWLRRLSASALLVALSESSFGKLGKIRWLIRFGCTILPFAYRLPCVGSSCASVFRVLSELSSRFGTYASSLSRWVGSLMPFSRGFNAVGVSIQSRCWETATSVFNNVNSCCQSVGHAEGTVASKLLGYARSFAVRILQTTDPWLFCGSSIKSLVMVMSLTSLAVLRSFNTLVDWIRNQIEPRGAGSVKINHNNRSGIVLHKNAVMTSLDRPELQMITCNLTRIRRIIPKPANLYTRWFNIPHDYEESSHGRVRKYWLTVTDDHIVVPTTVVQLLASNLCTAVTVDGNFTYTGVVVAREKMKALTANLGVAMDVRSDVCYDVVWAAFYDALPRLRLQPIRRNIIELICTGSLYDSFNKFKAFCIEDRKPTEHSRRWWGDVVLSPILEEYYRIVHPAGVTAAIIAWEMFLAICTGNWKLILGQAITSYFLHYTCYGMCYSIQGWKGLFCRIALHSYWNWQSHRQMAAASTGSLFRWRLENAPKLKDKPAGLHEMAIKFPEFSNLAAVPHGDQICFGLASASYRPVAFGNSLLNTVVSLKQRVLYDEVGSDAPAVSATRKAFIEFWTDNGCSRLRDFLEPRRIKSIGIGEYLKRSNAMPGVKKRIQQANDKQWENGVRRHYHLTKAQISSWSKVSCFVKVENLNYRTGHGVKLKAPRMIMGSRPEYLALVGPWTVALSDHIKTILGGGKGVLFTSGCTARQASDYLGSYGNYVNEETDVAHWDRSVHRELRLLEYEIYKLFDPPRAILQLLFADANQTRGVCAKGVVFKMFDAAGQRASMRPSGRPDTSLMNSVLNALIRLWGFCTTWGLTVSQVSNLVKILVQGDDGASRSPIHMRRVNWTDVFACVGFELEYKLVSKPSELSFCSMLNYPVLGGHCFGPKVGRIFGKTCYALDPHPKINLVAMARGIALGLKSPASYIEPLQMWIDRLLELCGEGDVIDWHREEWQMEFSSATADASTAHFLFERYGWCDSMRDGFKVELSQMRFGCCTGGTIYNHIVECDTDGPVAFMRL